MPRRLRSWFQMCFKRHGNAEDREGSKDQEQSRPAPLLGLPTFTQHIFATISTSSFPLPASLPLPAAPATGSINIETSTPRPPATPATGSADTETSTPRPPATPATGSADTETSAGVDNTKQVKNLYYNFPISRSHIRLLQLLPSENEDAAIHCELFCTALDSKGTRPYKALSYVWGSKAKPHSIFINGCDLAVGENLYAALLHLRDHSIQRTIWIDAICINQGDNEEKGHQVQSMAKIYAKASRVIVWLGKEAAGSDQALEEIRIAAELSTRQLDNKAGILTLLERPWFQRIWVLQEVAAARHILIKCGSAEVDGFAFCSGLKALNLSNELPTDLRARILSITYLIRGAIFRPKYMTSQSDNFSLDIRPLGELIEMYYTRKATDRRDKVYALLGMSSDNPTAAGLFADYNISWKQLFNKLIHFFLSELVSVGGLSDDKENAVIEGKGSILGEVSSVKRNATWEDRQDVAITWSNAPSYTCMKEAWGSCWTLLTTVKSVQKGDVICLLQGASRPTILRPYNDHWVVIMISVSPVGDSQATTGDIKWSELLQSITVFPHNFLLIWDWDTDPDRQQDKNNHDYFTSIPVPKHSKTGLEGCINAATRIRNVRLVLQEVKQYGVVVKNLREETEVLERALRSMSNLKKTCLGPEDSKKEDAKETMVNQLIEDKGQWTLLYLAAANGHETVVKLLLDTSKVNLHKEELQTALWFAAQKDYKAIVKMLLDTGKVDAGAKDVNGQTALHRAAITGHEVVVQLLFDTVEVDLHSTELQKVLHMAAENGQEAVIKLLLDTGKVDAGTQDRDGQTALHIAAKNRHKVVVKLLLNTGKVDANAQDRRGRTALHIAAKNGHKAVIKLLLDSGKVDADPKDKDGRTALHSAAENGHSAIVKLLLDTGKIDADPQNRDGQTALYMAAVNGHEAVVKLLLDTGKVDADPNGWYKQTALHMAAAYGHEAIVKLLLDTGKVDAGAKDENGQTALYMAAKNGHEAVVKLLSLVS